ncbi:MAG: helix-turn-helix transcriptional regulator [bacterium]
MEINYKKNVKSTLRNFLSGRNPKFSRIEFCEKLNIGDSALKRWLSENDNNGPQTEILPLICDILNISLYDLYQIENPANSLSKDELTLLNEYRKQTHMQQAIKNTLKIDD